MVHRWPDESERLNGVWTVDGKKNQASKKNDEESMIQRDVMQGQDGIRRALK